ncbi:MAG: UDP-N-acetylglucosamine 2-epimerase (non-hydrolyzing) [Nitriliruptorales bacterium]|nr:UDP-N-acetylglucosamine 2-epimerase (non-hydrolyzing) [Nitriliruptorales bacterium]
MSVPVAHVVGARPNFMKAAPVIDALAEHQVGQFVIHTGQHYDEKLSKIFFEDLGLPQPDVNLGVGSASHAAQTAALLEGLEETVLEHEPRVVVVYGDVNSTLAAALVCAKLMIPLVHVEAGLRSFDRSMPEEVNRVLTDQVATLLLATSPEAYGHLANEGIEVDKVRFVGNPMIDTLLQNLDRLEPEAVQREHELPDRYAVSTLHRPANVDDPATAKVIVAALKELSEELTILIPLHPRGREQLEEVGLVTTDTLRVIEPLGYVDFLSLVRGATLVITDSGGVQEETTILNIPCLTVRPNTERPITITHGTNRLVAPEELAAAAGAILHGDVSFTEQRPPLWDGQAGPRCAAAIMELVEQP